MGLKTSILYRDKTSKWSLSVLIRRKPRNLLVSRAAVIGDLKKLKLSSEWHFLTDEEPNIRKLSDQLGFGYKLNAETGLYSHASGIFILDSKANLLVSLADVMYPKDVLDYSLIKAWNGTLGSWSQKFNIFWRAYDFENNNLKLDFFKFGLFVWGCLVALFVIYKFALQSKVNK